MTSFLAQLFSAKVWQRGAEDHCERTLITDCFQPLFGRNHPVVSRKAGSGVSMCGLFQFEKDSLGPADSGPPSPSSNL